MAEISVLVPVYNVEKYLNRCIDSILAQTFIDFELILVDDGSLDRSPQICDEYARRDARIIVIHQNNSGRSAARNKGLDWFFSNSKSKWIVFVDGDDWIHPQNLELLYEACLRTQAVISMGRWESAQDLLQVEKIANANVSLKSAHDAYLCFGIGDYLWGRMYHRSLFSDTRFPLGKNFEDVFVVPNLLFSVDKIATVDAILYYYYINQDGIVASPWSISKIDAYDAREKEIIFFEKLGYLDICREHAKGYMAYLMNTLEKLGENPKKNKESIRMLKKKKKRYFYEYAKYLDIRDESDAYILTKAFPKRMKVYWYYQALNKLFIG